MTCHFAETRPGELFNLSGTRSTCRTCGSPVTLPGEVQGVYVGHIELDGVLQDRIAYINPMKCPNCNASFADMYIPHGGITHPLFDTHHATSRTTP